MYQHGEELKKKWKDASIAELIDHINDYYHVRLIKMIEDIKALMAQCMSADCTCKDSVSSLDRFFSDLSRDLLEHLKKEEEDLFPHIRNIEKAKAEDLKVIERVIRELAKEHGEVGEELKHKQLEIVEFLMPETTHPEIKRLRELLDIFNEELKEHIYIENNILFEKIKASSR